MRAVACNLFRKTDFVWKHESISTLLKRRRCDRLRGDTPQDAAISEKTERSRRLLRNVNKLMQFPPNYFSSLE